MNGPNNYHETLTLLKERHGRELDPLYKRMLESEIKKTYGLIAAESVAIMLAQESAARAARNTHKVSIKCGLRNATGGHMPGKEPHWFWDSASAKDAKELERIRVAIMTKLFFTPEKALVRKFHILGGFSKALKSLGLEALTKLPEETRREKGQVILKLIEKELNQEPDKLPFC